MVEVLIVVAILALLLILSAFNSGRFIVQGFDVRRKSDLEAYRVAFERYYEDNKCYPDPSLLTQCNTRVLIPYLQKILCDPSTKQPYTYVKTDCTSYTLYTTLNNPTDPSIAKVGCTNGCGPDTNGDGTPDYNYGVSSGNTNAGNPTGSLTGGAAPGTCTLRRKQNQCIPNLCSSCCPGQQFRCNAVGDLCLPDDSCTLPPEE